MAQEAAETLVGDDLAADRPRILGRLDELVPDALMRPLAVVVLDDV